ncbi:MAG: 50S ribosomal protein L25 [Candidatus Aminicenantes bacterium]|nr:MAG: 50S ribosomal protein L25 [Candidatus Aminicenantes bacterium]
MSFKIKGETRNVFGKNASRRIRQEGMIPAILYDTDTVSIPLTLNKKDVFAILKAETGENTIFKISFNSETRNTMIKELQRDPVTDEILHADLIQIAMDNVISVSVPIVLVGEAVGVKTEGGFVDFVTREAEIECLPKNIPEKLEIDISSLHLHQSLKIEDLSSLGEITLVSDPNTVVVLIHAPTKEELEVEEIEEEIIAEEEPEVIKKEKPEEEEKEKEEKEEKEKE